MAVGSVQDRAGRSVKILESHITGQKVFMAEATYATMGGTTSGALQAINAIPETCKIVLSITSPTVADELNEWLTFSVSPSAGEHLARVHKAQEDKLPEMFAVSFEPTKQTLTFIARDAEAVAGVRERLRLVKDSILRRSGVTFKR
ncbi:MAG: hypothetical protein AB7G06_03330 [Bdellovibrionales bacterium]